MQFVPSTYAAADTTGLADGVYLVGDYLYSWFPTSGDLFLRAEPGSDYSDNLKKIADPPMRGAVFAAMKTNGRKILKDEIRANRERIAALPKAPPLEKPEDVGNPPPPGSAAFYKEPWFWAASVGGTALLGYIGYTVYKARK